MASGDGGAKLADLLLIESDPSEDIVNAFRARKVIVNRRPYDEARRHIGSAD